MKDIHDVITYAKFGDDCLRGLGVVAGQISAFPIDFAGRPYNTLTLPCERVILNLALEMASRGISTVSIVSAHFRSLFSDRLAVDFHSSLLSFFCR